MSRLQKFSENNFKWWGLWCQKKSCSYLIWLWKYLHLKFAEVTKNHLVVVSSTHWNSKISHTLKNAKLRSDFEILKGWKTKRRKHIKNCKRQKSLWRILSGRQSCFCNALFCKQPVKPVAGRWPNGRVSYTSRRFSSSNNTKHFFGVDGKDKTDKSFVIQNVFVVENTFIGETI